MSTAPHSPSPSTAQVIAAAQLPERVGTLLLDLHRLVMDAVAHPLLAATGGLERDLFRQAERAAPNRQHELYAEMRGLRENGAAFVDAFSRALAQALVELEPAAIKPGAGTEGEAFQNLTLVQDRDIDRDILLHELGRREAARSATALILLSQRFGVLAGKPAFEMEQLALGPHGLARVLRASAEALQIGLETQLALYQAFEKQVMAGYPKLVEQINTFLADAGVLPGLVYQPYFTKGSPRRRALGSAADEPAENSGRTAGKRPLTSWMGQGPSASWSSPMGEAFGELATAAPGAPMPASGMPAADAAAGAMPAMPGSPSLGGSGGAPAAPPSGMSALHQLLGAARAGASQHAHAAGGNPGTAGSLPGGLGSLGADPAMAAALSTMETSAGTADGEAAAGMVPVPSTAVMDVLSKLQGQAALQAATGRKRTIQDIQQALLSQVRAEYGPQASLQPQDADTLDLLSLLYSQIQREVRNDTPAATMLTQLQVPVVRAAISDPAFFIRDQHPARELLNAVAESGATWLNDEDMDPVLLQRLGKAVNRVVTEYDGDETVFANANAEVQGYFRAAAHKAEITERRQIEAARGKERLETAKQQAERTIAEICAMPPEPPRFVQTLLQQAWSDVLTLTLLRQGENSAEWKELLAATRKVAQITAAQQSTAPDPELGERVQESLSRVGYHEEEAGAIARRLSTPGGEDESLSKTELLAKLKNKSRLGVDEAKQAAEEARRKLPPRNETEEAHYQQLRTLPFGTWFEFVINQQGDTRRQRLSWYSLMTDNALFVNARGQKVAEHTLDALSRLMAQDQVRIVTEDKGRLIDRAWQATLRALRTLAGRAPAPESDE